MSMTAVTPSASISEESRTPASARGNAAAVFHNHAIDYYVDKAAADYPIKPAIVDATTTLTWSDVESISRRLANGLASLGVEPGDRVAVQLPNWHQFPLLEYALSRLGAVCVPLPAIYRQRELKFMLGLVEPVVVVVPSEFRNFNHASVIEEIRPLLPTLKSIVVVGKTSIRGHIPYDELLNANPFAGPGRTDPDAVTEIVFTSGTTGEPKGVMHSANTNLCPLFSLIKDQVLDESEKILMASTFGHQTGFVYGGQLPAVLGGTLVLMDQWDARVGAALIKKEGVTWTMGATPFLQDLVDYAPRDALATLRTFLCSGAPIPQSLLAAARATTSASIASGWGMTEVGLVTLSRRGDLDERIAGSDGKPFDCMEIRVVDDDGNTAAADEQGDLLCRGPSMFLGYYRRPRFTHDSFSRDGWMRTGDRGRVDGSGYLRIVGRTKDIIIRGGENIPVIEVEDLLRQHPAVERVALVAVPDPRMQERACAVVVLRPGQQLSFEGMREHLLQFKLAQQYIPEHFLVMESLPMTPSGKVQKFVLRKQVLEGFAAREEGTNEATG